MTYDNFKEFLPFVHAICFVGRVLLQADDALLR
jgi:hypothetical protein